MVFKSYISRISHKATSSSISYTKSVHDMKDTAKKEWHICWNTCCSKAQKTWETSKNCFLKKEVRLMEPPGTTGPIILRSEEHTSELQSRGHLVCRLLLEKK